MKGERVGRLGAPNARSPPGPKGVVRGVDLDDVEALGVVPEPGLRGRDPAGVPGLEQALVGPEHVPIRTVAVIGVTLVRGPLTDGVAGRASGLSARGTAPDARTHWRLS